MSDLPSMKVWLIPSMSLQFFSANECLGVSYVACDISYMMLLFYNGQWTPNYSSLRFLLGVKVSCPGNPGHGSRFIEGTAAEKLRTVINRFLDFRQQEKNRLEANPELTLGDVTSVNLTKIEVNKFFFP